MKHSAEEIATALGKATRSGNAWKCCCPAHDDNNPSLSVMEREDGVAVKCHAGCSNMEVVEALKDRGLWSGATKKKGLGKPVATYNYFGSDRKLAFQVLRFANPKTFRQKGADGKWKVLEEIRVPYRLPELLDSAPDKHILIAEGEKDVDNLIALGFTATCNPGGAKKWRDSYGKYLKGHPVSIIPDNDTPGLDHARHVASLIKPYVSAVRIVELARQFKDVSDYIQAGAVKSDIEKLCLAAETWESSKEVDDDEAIPPEFSDSALAGIFTATYGNVLKYVVAWGKWFWWDRHQWKHDNVLHAYDMARTICNEQSFKLSDWLMAEGKPPTPARGIASSKTISSVEKLARSDRLHRALVGQWDKDPMLLNTPAGEINLDDGMMSPHNKEHFMSKITAVSPSDDAPQWFKFLDHVCGGDKELVSFLQRMAGYCLTGSTQDHALFFLYGTGRNGKSTFLNTIFEMMGDYAASAPLDAFTETNKGGSHPTDLAGLQAARLVSAVETDEGKRWAESRIKALTGGDPITARFMRQDFFTYVPQFKLVVTGNHKPQLRGVDEAMKRRIHLVPFSVTIPPDEVDHDLPKKLRYEMGGILSWAIEGCTEWKKRGLDPPACVSEATDEYFKEEDIVGRWVEDCCVVNSTITSRSGHLYTSWVKWCEEVGERHRSNKYITQKLIEKGFEKVKDGGQQMFIGIGVLNAEHNDSPEGEQ